MNKLTIIGNLTNDPELRTTTTGVNVCNFTVAVSRRNAQQGEPSADFFKVTAWREKGENCAKFLAKGRKVCVVGAVSVNIYTAHDGTTRAQMEIKSADEVEFLSPRVSDPEQTPAPVDAATGFEQVETDELPF